MVSYVKRMRFLLFVSTLVIILCAPTEIKGFETGYDFATICAEGNVTQYLTTWFQPGKQYNYDINISQQLTIVRGSTLLDNQTIRLYGAFHLTRRSEAEACVVDLEIYNLTVTFLNVDTNNEVSSHIYAPIHAAFTTRVQATNYDVSGDIFLLRQDQWKDNLVRSIISAVNQDMSVLDQIHHSDEILRLETPTSTSTTYPTTMTLYKGLDSRLEGFRFLTSPGMPTDGLPPHHDGSNKSIAWYLDNMNAFFLSEDRKKSPQYGFQTFAAEFKDTNLTGLDERVLTSYIGKEEQLIMCWAQLITNTTTISKFTLSSVEDPKQSSNPKESLFIASLKWDVTPPPPTHDLEPIQHFLTEVSKICQTNGDSDSVIKFMEKMHKLVRVIPISVLREGEDLIKKSEHCPNGLHLYYSAIASTPSDDTIEFIVETFLHGGANNELFWKFVWNALHVPPVLPEEEPYAGSRAVAAVLRLYQQREQLQLKLDEPKLLISMVGFLKKIRVPKIVSYDVDLNLKVKDFITILNESILDTSLDVGTRLEAKRTVDPFLSHRGMNPLTNTCAQMAGHDVFSFFKCIHPCDPQLAPFLEGHSNTFDITQDVQVIAYIIMRKCVNFNTKWRHIVETFVNNNTSTNYEDTKKFIHHHSYTIKDPILNTLSSQSVPESSKIGRTFYHKIETFSQSEYSTSQNTPVMVVELNVIAGNDSLPRMLRLQFSYITVYGMDQFFEVELLRSLPYDSLNSDKFNIFIAQRDSGYITAVSKTVPVDIARIKQMLQEFIKSKLNSNAQVDESNVSKYKQLFEDVLLKLFKHQEIHSVKTWLFEDRIRQFPTMSGLPLKSGVHFHNAILFNYKWDVEWKGGEFQAIFQLNPSISWSRAETTAIEFGHNDIIGYEIEGHHSVELNFGINVTTEHDQRTLLTKLTFSPPNGGDDDNVFFKNNITFLKLSRVQYVDSYTNVRKSDHILNFGDFKKASSEKVVQLKDYVGNLLEKGKCFDKWIKFEKPDPYHKSRETACSLPNVNILFEPSVGKPGQASLKVKIYPDNATEINTYSAFLRIYSNRKEYSLLTVLELSTPTSSLKFEGKLVQGQAEKSLQLMAAIDGTEVGIEAFLKKSFFNGLDNSSQAGEFGQRRENKNKQVTELEPYSSTPWSHKSYEIGIKGWKGSDPTNRGTMLFHGALGFVEQELFTTNIVIDSGGKFSSMDNKLNVSFSTRRNIIDTLKVNDQIVSEVVVENVTRFNFDLSNGCFGSISIIGEKSSSTPRTTKYKNNDEANNYGTDQIHRGFVKIPYTLRNGTSGTLLTAKYIGFDTQGRFIEDSPLVIVESNFTATFETSTYPTLDTNLDYWKITKILPPMIECPGCLSLNYTTAVGVQVKHFPQHHFIAKGSMINQNFDVEASLGLGLSANFSSQELCTELDTECHTSMKADVGYKNSLYNCRLNWIKPIYTQNESEGYISIGSLNVTKWDMDTASGYDYKLLIHNTLVENSTKTRYEGTLTNKPTGPKYKWNGNFNSELQIPSEKDSFATVKNIRELKGVLHEERWDNPISVYFLDDSSMCALRRDTILVANDTTNTFLDFKFNYNLAKDISEKIQLLTLFIMLKDYVRLNFDVSKGKASADFEVLPLDFNSKSSFLWSQKSGVNILKSSVAFHEISNPKARIFIMDSDNELEYFSKSDSIKRLLDGFDLLFAQNIRIGSKTRIRIKSISQKFVVAATLFPIEDHPFPSLHLEWILPTADKFLFEIKKQFHYNYGYLNDKTINVVQPCFLAGHWITMEQPGYEPFISDILLKGICDQKNTVHDGKSKERVNTNFALNYTLHHHDFFIPYLDTHLSLLGNFRSTFETEGSDYDGINRNIFQNNELVQVWNGFKMSKQLIVTIRADGRQQLPETKLIISQVENNTERETKTRGIYASLKNNLFHQEANLSFDSSIIYSSTSNRLGLSDNTLDSRLRTLSDNGHLYTKQNEFCYGFKSTNAKYKNPLFSLEGYHKLERVYQSWRNFEVLCTHSVNSTFRNISWEDKIYSKLDKSGSGILGTHSSNVFNFIMKLEPFEKTATLIIVPEWVKSMLMIKMAQTMTMMMPREQHFKWDIQCDSVLLHTRLEMSLSRSYSQNLENPLGCDHVIKLLYKIPLICGGSNKTYTGQLDSILRQYFVELENRTTAEVVSHVLKFQRWSHPYLPARVSWLTLASTSTLLKKDNKPIFLHHDFVSSNNQNTSNGTRLIELEGSISASVPTISVQLPQMVQVKLSYGKDEPSRNGSVEGFLRLGNVNSTLLETCKKSNWISSLSSKIQDRLSIHQLTAPILNQILHDKLYCEKCRTPSILSCSEAYGTLFAERQQNISPIMPGAATNKPQVIHNDIIEARWTKDQCQASQTKMKDSLTHPLNKDLSKTCTAALHKMKDKNPCWFDEADRKCDKSVKSKALAVWDKVMGQLKPVKVTVVGDAIIIGVQLLSV